MACIAPDGKPTASGRSLLRSLQKGSMTEEDIAESTHLLLYVVRSGLRELIKGGFVLANGDEYGLTKEGEETLS